MPVVKVYLSSRNSLEFEMTNADTNNILKAFEEYVLSQKQSDAAFRFRASDGLVLDFAKVELITGEH